MSGLFNIKTGFYLLAALAVVVVILWLDKEKSRLEGGGQETASMAEASKKALGSMAATPPDGKAVFMKNCKICHTFEQNGNHKAGPNLFGVAKAARGAKPGFRYSQALKNAGGAWSDEDLNAFLAGPRSYIKETKMAFAGLKNAAEREAVIAFLNSLQGEGAGN